MNPGRSSTGGQTDKKQSEVLPLQAAGDIINALAGEEKAGQIIREYRTDRCRTERLRIIGKQV